MARRIPPTFINELLNQINLIDLIEKRVALKKAGTRFVARCPFHQEKTASFYVDPQKQFYYCFGCHAHGNAIGFLMAYDRIDFIDAVENLAVQLGLPIPQEDGNLNQPLVSSQKYSDLYALMEKTTLFYQRCLAKSPKTLEYLKKRGISEKTIQHFRLGFAPNEWDTLAQKLNDQSELLTQLKEIGMLCEKTKSSGYYDRFRNRLMFPIQNQRNQIIGFGGRSIDQQTPKYLNSPETVLFHKGNELYGLNFIKKSKKLLVVEGYMDVITLHQAGINFAVAPLGTAITKKQIQILLRYAPEIIFCFDADTAGQKAAWRALEILLLMMKDSIHASFLTLPLGEDPDSFIQKKGGRAFESALQRAAPLSDFFFKKLSQPYDLTTIHGKTQFAQSAKQHLNAMPNGLFKQLMLEKLAQMIQVSPDQLLDSKESNPLPNFKSPDKMPPQARIASATKRPESKRPSALRTAITLLIQNPRLVEPMAPYIDMLKEVKIPGISLLNELIETTQSYSDLSTGAILEHFRGKPVQHKQLAKLAADTLVIPAQGLEAEFLGALKCIHQQGVQALINQLIQKNKVQELNSEEQAMLQNLITYNKSLREKKQ